MRLALNLEQLLHHPPGGIGSYTAELARLLPVDDGDGEHIDVVSFVARHSEREIDQAMLEFGLSGTEPVRLALPRPVLYDTWNVLGIPSLGALSSSLRDVDLVHAPSLAVPPRGTVPLIVTVHDAAPLAYPDTYPWRGRWFHKRGFEAASRRADVIIAPSEAAADEISSRTAIRRERIRIVPHGVTRRPVGDGVVAATRSILGIGDQPYVLWVGTFEPRKNLPVLVEAFRAVVATPGLPHRLVIKGSSGWRGAEREIEEAARALGNRVQFIGPVRADRLVALYHGADLFAFPSIHEGFGLPVLEAMSESTAVVCSDIPVLREVAGDAARFVPAGDPDAWGAALVELLGDDTGRAELRERGQARAAAFTWEQCVDRTRAVYREVLGGRR